MGKIYDDWGRLVEAVVRREKQREIVMCHSTKSSTISDGSSRFSFSSTSLQFQPETNFIGWHYSYHWDIASPLTPKSFFLMAGATNLTISCEESSKTRKRDPASMMYEIMGYEAMKIESVSRFEIRGKIKTLMLSRMTIYGAYIIYEGDGFKGFQSAKAIIRFGIDDANSEKREEVLNTETMREDGWMEVQIGSFYIGQEDYDENVEVRLLVSENFGNNALVVGGIEFRPLVGVKQV